MYCIFGALHLWCYVFALLVCYALASFFVHNRWCAATLVNYILVAIFLWCTVSSVRSIFGVMYMHFWYAMHRHLWWCLVGAITIVQCIFWCIVSWSWVQYVFGVASLVLCIVSYIAQACYHSGASTLLYFDFFFTDLFHFKISCHLEATVVSNPGRRPDVNMIK